MNSLTLNREKYLAEYAVLCRRVLIPVLIAGSVAYCFLCYQDVSFFDMLQMLAVPLTVSVFTPLAGLAISRKLTWISSVCFFGTIPPTRLADEADPKPQIIVSPPTTPPRSRPASTGSTPHPGT